MNRIRLTASSGRQNITVLFVAILMCLTGPSSSLLMIATTWTVPTTTLLAPTTTWTSPTPSTVSQGCDLNVPELRLSQSSSRQVNAVYSPRDPKNIPTGFARMCNKAGGFAPRPIWDDMTNGITPWFESDDGCFIYFNCNDAHWYVDNPSGAGLYLAVPDGSLLLPPTNGWVSLTGRRVGAPKMSFI
mmetsp:Transcript_24797/g.59818  ORF Transcript_24797/g.59818 Transcript_24797/m.59818 type:complete len:187 (-) Transcript_24797:105-665(-)